MFINKVSYITNPVFKGYQHEVNNVGEDVMRFNFPYDYDNEDCELQIFKVISSPDNGYKLVETPIVSKKLEQGGVEVNLQNITNLDKNEPFAYRFVKTNKTTKVLERR